MSMVTPPSGYCFKKVEMGVVSPTRPMWSTLPMCRCPLLENRLMEPSSLIVGQQLSGVGLELPACGRQRHHPAAAVKQTDVQLILQLADLLGQGGLGAGDLKGGLCKLR